MLNEIVQTAQAELTRSGYTFTIHPLYDDLKADMSRDMPCNPEPTPPAEQQTHKDLHISLTHPLPLRSHQIPVLLEHLKVELAGATNVAVKPFRLGLDCRVVKYRNGIARAASSSQATEDKSEAPQQDEVLEDSEDDTLLARQAEGSLSDADARDIVAGLGKTGVGKGGRAFLALRVRAGHSEVCQLATYTVADALIQHLWNSLNAYSHRSSIRS